VHLTGVPYSARGEVHADPRRADHVLITVAVPPFGPFIIAVNTFSRLNANAGFDPRVRLGIVPSIWKQKPEPALEENAIFDYAPIEAAQPLAFEKLAPEELTARLVERTRAAVRIEVWGELYARPLLGVHQIHSRRASHAMPHSLRNRDGALRFIYLENNAAELLLFKFDGQP
jgi:hypothetical protein